MAKPSALREEGEGEAGTCVDQMQMLPGFSYRRMSWQWSHQNRTSTEESGTQHQVIFSSFSQLLLILTNCCVTVECEDRGQTRSMDESEERKVWMADSSGREIVRMLEA